MPSCVRPRSGDAKQTRVSVQLPCVLLSVCCSRCDHQSACAAPFLNARLTPELRLPYGCCRMSSFLRSSEKLNAKIPKSAANAMTSFAAMRALLAESSALPFLSVGRRCFSLRIREQRVC
jgi:hypothetical protein